MFLFPKVFIFICSFSPKVTCALLVTRSNEETDRNKLFESEKRRFLPHFIFNGSVVDLALPSLPGGSLEIKLPMPLIKPETAQ